MTYRLPRSLGALAASCLALASFAPAARAIPLLGVGAGGGAYLGWLTGSQSGLGVDVDLNAQALGMDVTANYLGAPGTNAFLAEAGLRTELSFLPMLSIKPMIGYQGQTFFQPGKLDHAPLVRLDLGFSPILSPIWFEANAGASYPLGLGQPVLEYMAGGYFALLPMASVGARYRGYQLLQASSGGFGSVEVGLRVNI